MKGRANVISLFTVLLMLSTGASFMEREGGGAAGAPDGTRLYEPVLVLDRTVEVPAGGETRLVLMNGSEPRLEGYIGPSEFNYGKLGQAAELLPEWMKDDFIRNMLEAGSEELVTSHPPPVENQFHFNYIPSFGDLDGDGDEDMVIGSEGGLFFYKNVGGPGYPILIKGGFEGRNVIEIEGAVWISPEICDIDGDGYGDLIFGTDDEFLSFIQNPAINDGRLVINSLNFNMDDPLEDHLSPTIIKKGGQNLTLMIGCRNGKLYIWSIEIFLENGQFVGFGLYNQYSLVTMKTLNYSAPRSWLSWKRETSDVTYRIALGSGEGTLNLYDVGWPLDGGDPFFTPVPNYFQNIAHPGPITPAPVDIDGDLSPDIVLGTREPFMPEYINYQTDEDPYWAPDPTLIPDVPIENYLSAFEKRLTVYNESLIEGYLDSIIYPSDTRHRDEIGFVCSYYIPSELRGNRLVDIIKENARLVYSRDTELDYVSLREYGGDDYYTTASYKISMEGVLREMEIPMDAYYWGVVHPRITEEPIAYIDPESGGPALAENGGKFWRDYIYNHADSSYPEGPMYPDDWTGSYVYYPNNFTPPLLKEELEGVDYLWDLQPYEYPAGFDNSGDKFTYPDNFKDHALEKVSQWVERTLPLNQQESLDDERPNQPVRIARTHNGNCGELQDLTIAAARCALIPTRGANLPGEDHVWSEFYIGGWQQWDNYWSDGGGVIANDYNYWWGWGERGGSGIYASMGDGETVDIGERYRSPDAPGKLTVSVRAANNNPVNGARVVLLSHWMMDNVNVDVGPYQVSPPVTVPFPSIWGYTDDLGLCTFSIYKQDFNLEVSSDLGHYYSDKFTISSDNVEMTVQLQGNAPIGLSDFSGDPPQGGRRYLVTAEIISSYQEQTQFLTGEKYREEVDISYVSIEVETILPGEDQSYIPLDSDFSTFIPLTLPIETGELGSVLKFKKLFNLRTNTIIRIKVFEVTDEVFSEQRQAIMTNPSGLNDVGFRNSWEFDEYWITPEKLIGFIIDPLGNISGGKYRFVNDEGIFSILHSDDPWKFPDNYDRGYKWAYPCWTSELIMDLDAGTHSTELQEWKEGSDPRTLARFDLFIRDDERPEFTQAEGAPVNWGAPYSFGADFNDTQGQTGYVWIDHTYIGSVGPIDKYSNDWIMSTIDTGDFKGGYHTLRITCLDSSDNIKALTFGTSFIPIAPVINLTSPMVNDTFDSDEILISGSITDDVLLVSAEATYDGGTIDLMELLDENGTIDESIVLDVDPGRVNLTVEAVDNVGLTSVRFIEFEVLPPPDTEAPVVEIASPRNGDKVVIGEALTVRGLATDNTALSSLTLEVSGRTFDLLPTLVGSAWSTTLDTESWSEGDIDIRVTARDRSGRSGSDSVYVSVVEEDISSVDIDPPDIIIETPSQGTEIEAGETITVTGHIFDQSPLMEFRYSIDGGSEFLDAIIFLDNENAFTIEVPTDEVIDGLDLPPSTLRDSLLGYRIVLFSSDIEENSRYKELELPIIDTAAPMVLNPSTGIDNGKLKVTFEMMDATVPNTATFEVLDPSGSVKRTGTVGYGEMHEEGSVWALTWTTDAPTEPGTYKVNIVAMDAFGNSASAQTGFVIEEEDEGGGSLMFLALIPIVVVIVLLAVYGAVRILRKKGSG